eukprot:1139518-Pelagomonas_calceolata.AAC.3
MEMWKWLLENNWCLLRNDLAVGVDTNSVNNSESHQPTAKRDTIFVAWRLAVLRFNRKAFSALILSNALCHFALLAGAASGGETADAAVQRDHDSGANQAPAKGAE